VSEESRRVSEMHDEPYDRLGVVWGEHRMIDIPPQVGQVMSVPGWMGDKNEEEGLK